MPATSLENKYTTQFVMKWFFAALLFVTSICIFVPLLPQMPTAGLDSSWAFGMNQALAQGLVFGRDVIFTFGPYASIYTESFHPATDGLMLWSSLYLALSFGLAALLNFKESKWYFQILLLVVLAGGVMHQPLDALLFAYPLLVGVYLSRKISINPEQNTLPAILMLGVLLAPLGLLPLIKGSGFILCAAVVVLLFVLFAAQRDWKGAAMIGITPIVSCIIFWVLSGQPVSGLPLYFASMFQIISGYTEAMASDGAKAEIIYYIVAAIVLLGVVFYEEQSGIKQKIIVTLIFAATLFLSFKGGFVRHDGHAIISSATLLFVGLFVCSIYGSSRALLSFFIALFVWSQIYFDYVKTTPQSFFSNIYNTYKSSFIGLQMHLDGEHQLVKNFNDATQQIRATVSFPKLSGTTDIYSYDQSYLIASGNTWNPRPIFQSYSAYTPALIEKNRDHLMRDDSPDNLIFKVQPIDNRLPSLEDGASWPVILSKYVPVEMLAGDYLLLKKQASPTKILETTLLKEKATLGQTVTVPNINRPIFVKIHINQSIRGKIISILYKPSQLAIRLTLNNGETRQYRIISGMTETGFLLSPLVENTKELGLLYAGGKYLSDQSVRSFTIEAVHGKHLWIPEYEVEFVTIGLPAHPEAARLYG